VAAAEQTLGVQVGRAPELDDALADLIGVPLLLVGVLQKFLRDRLRVDSAGHEVVPAIAQRADDLGRQRLVQHADHRLAIAAVPFGHRAVQDVLAGAAADLFDIGQERLLLCLLWLRHAPEAIHELLFRQMAGLGKSAGAVVAADGAGRPL